MQDNPDMPVFTLLGQDSLAVDTVNYWLERAAMMEVNPDKLAKVQEHLDALVQYSIEHPEMMKKPD